MLISKKNHTKHMRIRGFTLLELMVVIGIFAILVSVFFTSQRSFDNSILTNNLAYDIALTIRQAQVYGISTKGLSGNFSNLAYGVRFELDDEGKSDTFVLFAEEGPGDTTVIQTYELGQGGAISNLCGIKDDIAACDGIDKLEVLFKRPNPEPVFSFYNNGGRHKIDSPTYSGAKIIISSPSGEKKIGVEIGVTGQIAVE